ncbi:hypothetical protein [Agrobacterium albertimagni]|uniref:hypothetical protein n=1 Tax=Agrobacterium albertimagni TaxID=147266 RepID=UPI0012FDE7A1|nr:hypothetical protein [Agrobacterium albertimagni]
MAIDIEPKACKVAGNFGLQVIARTIALTDAVDARCNLLGFVMWDIRLAKEIVVFTRSIKRGAGAWDLFDKGWDLINAYRNSYQEQYGQGSRLSRYKISGDVSRERCPAGLDCNHRPSRALTKPSSRLQALDHILFDEVSIAVRGAGPPRRH